MTFVNANNNHPFAKSFDGFLNDVFNELPAFGKNLKNDVFGFPPVNIVETPNAYQLQVAAPGLEKSDFNVKLEGNLLTISAEKKEETKDETAKTIRKEFGKRSFKRSFTLDEKIEATGISAKYENGILKVVLPKKEEAKPVSQDINIQ